MLLACQNLCFKYGESQIFDNLNFYLNQGELVYLTGASGAGKTTLLKLIIMEHFPNSGIIQVGTYSSDTIKKSEIPELRRKLGIIFQDFKLLSSRTIFDNLAFILHSIGVNSSEIKKRVMNSLSDVGLIHRRNSYPTQLSGGEQQRIAIARAMINNPFLLIADEPTGNLDPETSEQIIQLLKKINMSGTSVLIATHKYESVSKNSKIVRLKDGKLFDMVFS